MLSKAEKKHRHEMKRAYVRRIKSKKIQSSIAHTSVGELKKDNNKYMEAIKKHMDRQAKRKTK